MLKTHKNPLTNIVICSFVYLLVITINNYAQEQMKKELSDEEIRKANEYQVEKERRNNNYLQTLNSAIVIGNDTSPLIQLKENQKCLLSIKEYNSIISYEYSSAWKNYLKMREDSIPELNIESIRQNIINSVLKKAFLNDQWNKIKETKLFVDSLNNETIRYVNKEKNEMSDSILKIKYNQYYRNLFARKNNSLYYVFTSTDSAALANLLTKIGSDNVNSNKGKRNLLKKGYSANVLRYDSLPKQMRTIADTLKTDEWSNITETKWGYFVLGVYLFNIKQEIPFAEAVDKLIYMPETNDEMFHISDKEAYDFFNNNKSLFHIEDTLLLSVKIKPIINDREIGDNNESLKESTSIKVKACKSTDLPDDIMSHLVWGEDTCSGWIDRYNGKWRICLNGKIKSEPVGFEPLKNQVKDYLLSKLKENKINEYYAIGIEKQNDRSYNLFVDKFFTANSKNNKENELQTKNWAENKIQVSTKLFQSY